MTGDRVLGVGREYRPASGPVAAGGTTEGELGGPWHAVEGGGEDLASVTSLCNRTVLVWGDRVFDAVAPDACPTCAERSR